MISIFSFWRRASAGHGPEMIGCSAFIASRCRRPSFLGLWNGALVLDVNQDGRSDLFVIGAPGDGRSC